jgi:NADPH2:quinone reductase
MARFVCAEKPGNADVLQVRDRPTPTPGPGEVLIEQTAIGLNFIDIYQTSGIYPFPENELFVPGNEAAGRVMACGEGVTGFAEGDRVGYPMVVGAYAEERIIPAAKLVRLPDNVSDEVAAASMLKGMTVEYLVNRSAHLSEGDVVLFHAAAGGVGLIAGQWLKHKGVTVIGTAGSAEKVNLAKQAGYDHVINYSEENFVDAVMDYTNGTGVKVVYDSVGKDTYPHSLKVLQNYGLLVSFGQSSGLASDFKISDLAPHGSLYLQRPTLGTYIATAERLADVSANLFDMLANDHLSISINQRYDLADAAAAFEALTSRKTTGATIFTTGR